VIGEITLSVVLVTAAGLLVRSFVALNTVELGYKPDHLLVVDVNVPGEPARAAFYRELLAELSTAPGVVAAGASTGIPGRVASGARTEFRSNAVAISTPATRPIRRRSP
jgi:hypothetical protein